MLGKHFEGTRMSATVKILDRLQGAKQTGAGRWIARCPAHEDRSPSLSIRETDDGRVLVHDFGGCESGDVLAAVGLSFADLFDRPLDRHLPPVRGGFSARELLELISHEVTVAELLIADARARNLAETERTRLATACARITQAMVLSIA
jgi:hypothetical protein